MCSKPIDPEAGHTDVEHVGKCHTACVKCGSCGTELFGQVFFSGRPGKNTLACRSCADEAASGPPCNTCGLPVAPGAQYITYSTGKGEVNVHKTPECHKCARCGKPFEGQEFRLNFQFEPCHTTRCKKIKLFGMTF